MQPILKTERRWCAAKQLRWTKSDTPQEARRSQPQGHRLAFVESGNLDSLRRIEVKETPNDESASVPGQVDRPYFSQCLVTILVCCM
eukprot:3917733-Amphidinium_carterae.1